MVNRLQRSLPLPFTHGTLMRIPQLRCGVYVFWSASKSRAVYIGRTARKIGERLREHYRDSHSPLLRTWITYWRDDLRVCYVSAPDDVIAKLERRLIRLLDPHANERDR